MPARRLLPLALTLVLRQGILKDATCFSKACVEMEGKMGGELVDGCKALAAI